MLHRDSGLSFYRELARQGVSLSDVTVMSFSMNEEDLQDIDRPPFAGSLAAWSYFMRLSTPENTSFLGEWKKYTTLHGLANAVTNEAMEATYIGINMWAKAVELVGTTNRDQVTAALERVTFRSPSGYDVSFDATHHLRKPAFIGMIRPDGQFDPVWTSAGVIEPETWSQYVPEARNRH